MKFLIQTDVNDEECFFWIFQKKDGTAVCQSIGVWETEKECRSAIASAKISMRGARFAKVEVDDVHHR